MKSSDMVENAPTEAIAYLARLASYSTYFCRCATCTSEMQQMTIWTHTSIERLKRAPDARRMRPMSPGACLLSDEWIMDNRAATRGKREELALADYDSSRSASSHSLR